MIGIITLINIVYLCATIEVICERFNTPAVYQLTQPVTHGEGPSWDQRKGLLYYVDITEGSLHSYEFSSGKTFSVKFNGNVSPVVQSKNPEVLIIGLNRSVVAIKWDGKGPLKGTRVLTTLSPQFPTSRINDGKADSKGRLWFGTMGFENAAGVVPNQGALYKISKSSLDNPVSVLQPVNVSNGLAWNKANNKFYYIDSLSYKVIEYDYFNALGIIKNPRVVFDVRNQTKVTGIPDGMTIDKDDNLWVALNKGGSVIKINPKNGNLLQVVALPASDVTSVMWGGPDLDVLFVTSSRRDLNQQQRKVQPAAGSLFAVTNLKTRGIPVFEADIIDDIVNAVPFLSMPLNRFFSQLFPRSSNVQWNFNMLNWRIGSNLLNLV